MKHYSPIVSGLLIAALAVSCNALNKKPEVAQEIRFADSVAMPVSGTLDANLQEMRLPDRRFVRTADLKFKVQDVSEATGVIEIKVRQMEGFVTNASILNTITDSTATPFSEDSLRQAIHYTMNGLVVLRVPDNRLDSFLAAVQPLCVFLVHRDVRAEDVSLKMLDHQWTARRSRDGSRSIIRDIDQQKNKLTETLEAESRVTEQRAAADQALLSHLGLEDAVKYSTVSISLYQEPGVRISRLFREKPAEPFEPSFWKRIVESAADGLQAVGNLLVFLARIWILIGIAAISLWVYRKYFLVRGRPGAGTPI